MQRIWLMFLIGFSVFANSNVSAFELFGVTVNAIDRVKLREAIRNSGAEVVREAGDDNWYDVYDMTSNFKQSKQLYVAYEKTNGQFAFAEYHLPYAYFNTMLTRLKFKYGKPSVQYGTFESDTKYLWLVDGINILLQLDWAKNVSRLQYTQNNNLAVLQQAYQQSSAQKFSDSLELNQSYF